MCIYFVKYSLRYELKCIEYDFEFGLNIYWIDKSSLRDGLKCIEYGFDILVKFREGKDLTTTVTTLRYVVIVCVA